MKSQLEQVIAKSNTAKLALSKVGVELGSKVLCKVYGQSIELITCTDDSLTERLFGGNVDVTGYTSWKSNNREVKISTGSMGAFDPSCKASMSKIAIQHSIVSQWDKFVLVVTLLMDKVETENQLEALLQD